MCAASSADRVQRHTGASSGAGPPSPAVLAAASSEALRDGAGELVHAAVPAAVPLDHRAAEQRGERADGAARLASSTMVSATTVRRPSSCAGRTR